MTNRLCNDIFNFLHTNKITIEIKSTYILKCIIVQASTYYIFKILVIIYVLCGPEILTVAYKD